MRLSLLEYNKMTYLDQDTICAIATAPGCGGIAVARISGPSAIDIVQKIWQGRKLADCRSHTAHLGNIIYPGNGTLLDQAVATLYKAPHSYTGDDVVELAVHGSTWIQSELLRILIDSGARMAEPGEFTRRAFTSGRMDLAEAEAVADLIESQSAAAHRVAMNQMRGMFSQRLEQLRESLLNLASLIELELDFSEEEVEFASREQLSLLSDDIYNELSSLTNSFANGSAIKNGIPVAIIGETNAGKSTLLNRLLGEERAIVSDIHGTTRDTIEDTLSIHGTLYRLIDTAGLRETNDPIETIGITRAIEKASHAKIVIWVIDPTSSSSNLHDTATRITSSLSPDSHLVVAVNKADIADTDMTNDIAKLIAPLKASILTISAAKGTGLEHLTNAIHKHSGAGDINENTVMVTNARHYQALDAARTSINRVRQGIHQNLSGDFIAQDLRETLHHLGTITGTITTPDILTHIFSHFCIGK